MADYSRIDDPKGSTSIGKALQTASASPSVPDYRFIAEELKRGAKLFNKTRRSLPARQDPVFAADTVNYPNSIVNGAQLTQWAQ